MNLFSGRLFLQLTFIACFLDLGIAWCPNDCSQHGVCSGPGPDSFCICEGGWTEENCSRRYCPKGDDPETSNQGQREIIIRTGAKGGQLEGHFDFSFMGQSVGFDAIASEISLTNSLQALSTVETVSVTRTDHDTHGGAEFRISFIRWPSGRPVDNNLYSHDGNPPLSFFKCSTTSITGAVGPFCEIENTGVTDSLQLKEYVSCSNHGDCNPISGDCKCHRGWRGQADDLNLMHADGPFFSGAVTRIRSHRAPSSDFVLLAAEAADGRAPILTLDGKGDLSLHSGNLAVEQGSVSVRGSIKVSEGSLDVQGALTVNAPNGGVSIALESSKDVKAGFNSLGVAIEGLSLVTIGASAATMVTLQDQRTFDFLTVGPVIQSVEEAAANGLAVNHGAAFLRVDSSGVTHVGGSHGGGLTLEAGSVDVRAGSIEVAGNISALGGLIVGAGAKIDKGSLVVRSGSALVRSPSQTQPALTVISTAIGFNSSVLELASEGGGAFLRAVVDNSEASLFEVTSDGGIEASGGIHTGGGGIQVDAGGIDVIGGIKVSGGLLMRSGTLDLSSADGVHIGKGGLFTESGSEGLSPLVASATSASFRGSVLRLEAAGSLDPEGLNFIEATLNGSDSSFHVNGAGHVFASGLKTPGSVEAANLHVTGRAAIQGFSVKAGNIISVDRCQSFARIFSDGHVTSNVLSLPIPKSGENCNPEEGQLLFIFNGDEEKTTGAAEIPPGRSVLFIFSQMAGPGWIPLTTLDARSSQLQSITAFTAANNLDIGPHSFKAQQLVAAGQTKGHVAIYGSGGLLAGEQGLTFVGGLLSTARLNVKQVDSSNVDFMGSPLTNVRIESGSASGLSVLRTSSLFLESVGEAGQILVAGPNSAIASAKSVYVSKIDEIETLVAPSLRLSGLATSPGALAFVGLHGELVSRADLEMVTVDSFGDILSVIEANELVRRNKPVSAMLRSPRIATEALSAIGEKATIRIEADLELGGRILRGATIVESSLTGLDELGVDRLTVRGATGSSLAFFSENSTMMSLPGATLAGGVVTFETAGIKKLSCDLDIGGHSVVNLKVSGGTLDGIASVSTSELFLSDAAAAVSAVGHSIIATLGPKGRLETSSLAFDSANKVFFPGNVGGHAWAGSVDAKGQMLKNPMIVGGSLSKMAEVQSDGGLSCKGDLDVSEDASVGGTLVVGGTVMGSGPYVDSSDRRLKANITDMFENGGAVELVKALRPVRYRFKPHDRRRFSEKDEIGFIAQEIEALVPEIVTTDSEGFMGVAYSRMAAVLVGAIQELAAVNDLLQSENLSLRGRVEALEATQRGLANKIDDFLARLSSGNPK